MSLRLYLVRHPKPSVAPAMCYGASDVAVSNDAIQAALDALAGVLPAGVPVFSSPLQRCTALATPLAASLGAGAPSLDARLAEMDFGDWEMRSWDAIERAEINAWAADLTGYRPGSGENVLAVGRRVIGFLDDLLKTRQPSAIVICHAGTIRLLLAWQNGDALCTIARRAASVAHEIAYGQMLVLDCRSSPA